MPVFRVVESWTEYQAWYVEAESAHEAVEALSEARDAEENDEVSAKAGFPDPGDSEWEAFEIAPAGHSDFTVEQLRAIAGG